MIFVGLDAARRHVCLLDAAGQPVTDLRLQEGWWGLRQLHGLIADLGGDASEVVVGVEQQRGLLVEMVTGAGYRVFALGGPTVDFCRFLRNAVEGSEPSRAAVIAGLVRSLHPGLQPLAPSASLAGHARRYRQLAWAQRYEQQRLRGLLARRTGGEGWPSNADIDQPDGGQRLLEALGVGCRVSGQPGGRAGACLAALNDLELRIEELERPLLAALSSRTTGGSASWQPDEEGGRSSGPGIGALWTGRGRKGVAAAAVVGLSLGLVAPHRGPSGPRGAGVVASPVPAHVDMRPPGDSGLWFAAASANAVTKHPGAHPAGVGPHEGTGALRPVGVEIPAIDLVTPPLVDLGLTAEGGLEVPEDFAHAGWYAGSAVPGDPGPAVIVGHYDSRRGPAVFYRLTELAAGDAVVVRRSDDSSVTFLVERVARYRKDHFPTEEVYGPTGAPTLRLITCGGRFNRVTGHYEDNLVVFARQPPVGGPTQ